ncbi:MAG: glucose-1-phosphate cytidylyltransferase [Desulfobacterales bacterium]|nr:glucose-1-phosphate cytidylyltransferase [Desulfobacterales bacterium]
MKVLILAGGLGSRLSEETVVKPKPMVEIGGKPVLWHIMKIYSHYGFNDFIILCGYKGYILKEYFANYFMHCADVTFDLAENRMKIHNNPSEPWKVTLLDTGLETMTGGRVLRARKYMSENEPFMLTYGDGVADINISELISFHKQHGKAITMTSSQPAGRFGALDIVHGGKVSRFVEKPKGDGSWINAGYFVCEMDVFNYIEGDETVWEQAPLKGLSEDEQLYTYQHSGFWHPMDTLRDKIRLGQMWNTGKAPWKMWDK